MKWTIAILVLAILAIGIFLETEYNRQPTGQAIIPSSNEPATAKNSLCLSINGLPDANCTPGTADATVAQDNIQSTICVSGYTETVRPSISYTNALKMQQIKDYGYTDANLSDYEEDHLISLELGGSPKDPRNLWPEPYNIPNGARVKDKLENLLHNMVCDGTITLTEAQQEIATNWLYYYHSYGLG